jgi:hypothetical protein
MAETGPRGNCEREEDKSLAGRDLWGIARILEDGDDRRRAEEEREVEAAAAVAVDMAVRAARRERWASPRRGEEGRGTGRCGRFIPVQIEMDGWIVRCCPFLPLLMWTRGSGDMDLFLVRIDVQSVCFKIKRQGHLRFVFLASFLFVLLRLQNFFRDY